MFVCIRLGERLRRVVWQMAGAASRFCSRHKRAKAAAEKTAAADLQVVRGADRNAQAA